MARTKIEDVVDSTDIPNPSQEETDYYQPLHDGNLVVSEPGDVLKAMGRFVDDPTTSSDPGVHLSNVSLVGVCSQNQLS